VVATAKTLVVRVGTWWRQFEGGQTGLKGYKTRITQQKNAKIVMKCCKKKRIKENIVEGPAIPNKP